MNNSLIWRGALILALVAIAAASAWPPDESINLGLDLQGGMQMVLEVEVEDALEAERERDMQRLVDEAGDVGVTGLETEARGTTEFVVTGIDDREWDRLEPVLDEEFGETWEWDRDGEGAVFEMDDGNAEEIRELAVAQALQTVRNRVDAYGVAEPVIQRVGLDTDRLSVQLPGVDDPQRIRRLIKDTAFLEFRLVDFPESGGAATTREEILANYGGRLPSDVEIMAQSVQDAAGNTVGERYYGIQKRQVVTGRDLRNARAGMGEFNDPVVLFYLSRDAGKRFGEITGANIGRGLAIVLDGRVVSAPVLRGRISDSGQIEGNFTLQEVEDLAMVLRSGALPAGMKELEERTVGPSLGRDSIEQGLRAGLIGFGLVILTMLLVYKLTGINAVVALGLNIVLVFGVLAYFDAALTLPGIAGIILTVGMAVDANVLVFERIKEELRIGRTVKSAIDVGFSKALSSILDANVTTLIAALFLFQFGTGAIRGFALTLTIGIAASVFTAVIVSRWIFDLFLSRRRRVEKLSI